MTASAISERVNVLPYSYCAGRFRGASTEHGVSRGRHERKKKAAEGSYSLPSVINKDRRSNGPESPRLGRPFFIQSAIIVENTNTGKIYLPISEFDSIEIFKRDTEILPS